MRRMLLIGALATMAAAPAAQATTTASVSGTTLTITGGDEVNHVDLQDNKPSPGLRVVDPAGVVPGTGCTAGSDATTAICGDDSTSTVSVSLGGGDDAFSAKNFDVSLPTVTSLIVDAGAGNDTIQGNNSASGRTDHFSGGDGNDTITGGTNNAAVVDGGTGDDTINGSTLSDTIHGGAGNDVINGLAGDDTLYGDDGNDTVSGNAGNDTVDGGAGTDTLAGDGNTFSSLEGNDTINAADGEADQVSCGGGSDTVSADAVDTVPASECEHVTIAGAGSGSTGSTPTTTTGTPAAPTVTVAHPRSLSRRALLEHGLRLTITTSAPIAAGAELALDPKTSRRLGLGRHQTVLGKIAAAVTGEARMTVRVKARFRHALTRARHFTVLLVVATEDGAQRTAAKAYKVSVR